MNPTLDRVVSRRERESGRRVFAEFQIQLRFHAKERGEFEYYGSVGPVAGFDAVSQQQHQIFPAIDLNLAPQWEINFGIGWGLT
jgi:hypothetical protein